MVGATLPEGITLDELPEISWIAAVPDSIGNSPKLTYQCSMWLRLRWLRTHAQPVDGKIYDVELKLPKYQSMSENWILAISFQNVSLTHIIGILTILVYTLILIVQRKEVKDQRKQIDQHKEEIEELRKQTQLAELEHQPHLELEHFSFDGDFLQVTLSNTGNGTAVNLNLETTLNCTGRYKFTSAQTELGRIVENEIEDHHSIRAGESQVVFAANPAVTLSTSNGNSQRRLLRSAIMDVVDDGTCESVAIHFRLIAHSLNGNQYSFDITTEQQEIFIEQVMPEHNLEHMIEQRMIF